MGIPRSFPRLAFFDVGNRQDILGLSGSFALPVGQTPSLGPGTTGNGILASARFNLGTTQTVGRIQSLTSYEW